MIKVNNSLTFELIGWGGYHLVFNDTIKKVGENNEFTY